MTSAAQPDPMWPETADDPRQPARRDLGTAARVALAVAAIGLPLGLLWAAVAPDVPILITTTGPMFAEEQPAQVAAADGWFTVLSAPFGVLAAVGAWRLARRIRGVEGLLAVTVGGAIAGALAWWLGRQVGLAGFEAAVPEASPGDLLERPPDLRVVGTDWWPPVVTGLPLVPALAAAVTYSLLAAWSRFADLQPGLPSGWTHRSGPGGDHYTGRSAEPDRPAGERG